MRKIPIIIVISIMIVISFFCGCVNDRNNINNSEDSENQRPIAYARASPRNGTAPLKVNFNGNDSYDPDGEIIEYRWDFDDNFPVIKEKNPTYTYVKPGNYTVRLIVIDNDNEHNNSKPIVITVH